MADGILAALTGAIGTIGGAAIAGTVVLRGLRNWREEVPGTRKIEVGEECLRTVYQTELSIRHLKATVLRILAGEQLLGDIREQVPQSEGIILMEQALDEAKVSLENMKLPSGTARIYFGPPCDLGQSAMAEAVRSAGLELQLVISAIRMPQTDVDERAYRSSQLGRLYDRWLKPLPYSSHDEPLEMVSVAHYDIIAHHLSGSRRDDTLLATLFERVLRQRLRPPVLRCIDRNLPNLRPTTEAGMTPNNPEQP